MYPLLCEIRGERGYKMKSRKGTTGEEAGDQGEGEGGQKVMEDTHDQIISYLYMKWSQ
jgi:hypothetical protein